MNMASVTGKNHYGCGRVQSSNRRMCRAIGCCLARSNRRARVGGMPRRSVASGRRIGRVVRSECSGVATVCVAGDVAGAVTCEDMPTTIIADTPIAAAANTTATGVTHGTTTSAIAVTIAAGTAADTATTTNTTTYMLTVVGTPTTTAAASATTMIGSTWATVANTTATPALPPLLCPLPPQRRLPLQHTSSYD